VAVQFRHEKYQLFRVNEFTDEREAILDDDGDEVWRKASRIFSLYSADEWKNTIKAAEEVRIESEYAASDQAKSDPLPGGGKGANGKPAGEATKPAAEEVDEDLGENAEIEI